MGHMPNARSILTPTILARIGGISVPFASQVLTGVKRWPRRLAIRIYRETGHKFGPIADASPDEIDVLEKYEAPT